MCGKFRYNTEKHALHGLSNAVEESRWNMNRRECAYYYCAKCLGFHLTSLEQNPQWRQDDITEKLRETMKRRKYYSSI